MSTLREVRLKSPVRQEDLEKLQLGDVVYIDPVRAYIVNGGLISFGIMADQVAEALSQ